MSDDYEYTWDDNPVYVVPPTRQGPNVVIISQDEHNRLQAEIERLRAQLAETEQKLHIVATALASTDNADRYYRGFNTGYDCAVEQGHAEAQQWVPLDAPDGPGAWAFEGSYFWPDYGEEGEIQRIWAVYPSGGALFFLTHRGIAHPVIDAKGKWYRLYLPWQAAPDAAGGSK